MVSLTSRSWLVLSNKRKDAVAQHIRRRHGDDVNLIPTATRNTPAPLVPESIQSVAPIMANENGAWADESLWAIAGSSILEEGWFPAEGIPDPHASQPSQYGSEAPQNQPFM